MAHHEPFDRAATGWGALFSDLLSVGLLPRAVLRKLLGNGKSTLYGFGLLPHIGPIARYAAFSLLSGRLSLALIS